MQGTLGRLRPDIYPLSVALLLVPPFIDSFPDMLKSLSTAVCDPPFAVCRLFPYSWMTPTGWKARTAIVHRLSSITPSAVCGLISLLLIEKLNDAHIRAVWPLFDLNAHRESIF